MSPLYMIYQLIGPCGIVQTHAYSGKNKSENNDLSMYYIQYIVKNGISACLATGLLAALVSLAKRPPLAGHTAVDNSRGSRDENITAVVVGGMHHQGVSSLTHGRCSAQTGAPCTLHQVLLVVYHTHTCLVTAVEHSIIPYIMLYSTRKRKWFTLLQYAYSTILQDCCCRAGSFRSTLY